MVFGAVLAEGVLAGLVAVTGPMQITGEVMAIVAPEEVTGRQKGIVHEAVDIAVIARDAADVIRRQHTGIATRLNIICNEFGCNLVYNRAIVIDFQLRIL